MWFVGRAALAGLAALVVWAGLTACLGSSAVGPSPASERVIDRFLFAVQDESLRPIPGAEIRVSVEAGRPLSPVLMSTDSRGRAELQIEARSETAVPARKSKDTLVNYKSSVNYVIKADGYLPAWGRADFFDTLESFSRADLATLMDRRPRDKSRGLTHTLIQTKDFFSAGALSDPLARTVAESMPSLWRIWWLGGRLDRVRPKPSSWSVVRLTEGPYLKVGLSAVAVIDQATDQAVHRVLVQDLFPFLDDLTAFYGGFAAGYDLTLDLAVRSEKDPHSMPEKLPLRLVFSETLRRQLSTTAGGLNWLITRAELCTLDDEPWNPVEKLTRAENRSWFLWRFLSPYFEPGPGDLPAYEVIRRTTSTPQTGPPGRF